MKIVLGLALVAGLASPVEADIYLHNPRGSNGRGCRNSNSEDRSGNEAQRLFDSQNNDKGGYGCGAAYPFACYVLEDAAERATCNEKNTGLSEAEAKAQALENGSVLHPDAIFTPKMYFYTGSELPIEWTVQHGSGANAKVHSDIIVQVACEEDEPGIFSFTDDCGTPEAGKTCQPRDGTAINNQDVTNTQRIPETPESQDDYRYGRHESYRFYKFCKHLERNKGLFTADQNLNGNAATATRQNPNNARNGFECPEESEYYPWWKPSPWIDVAIVTSNLTKCEQDRLLSQNVKPKWYCECPECDQNNGQLPNYERACTEQGGNWTAHPSWDQKYPGVEAPQCLEGPFSRDNHLGNVGTDAQPASVRWTIPDYLAGKNRCVLRVRYNISASDLDQISVLGDSRYNGDLSPLVDRNNNPEGVFERIDNLCTTNAAGCKLGLAVNTNQYGRTFQDRSHMFSIAARPAEPSCDVIYNLNVRGKRGNIVQTYPAVEYDFVPNDLNVTEADCVHVQWTGTDYNPNRNPNNGEGGPPNPNNVNEGKTDRSNLVQMRHERDNRMLGDANAYVMFGPDKDVYKRLAFLDQPIEDATQCLPYSELLALNNNNNDAADRDHRNCMKLSAARTPYFDAGLLKPALGEHRYMSTRNNNFSNRGQKGKLNVAPATTLSQGALAGVAVASVAGAGLLGAGLFVLSGAIIRGRAGSKDGVRSQLGTDVAGTQAYSAPSLAGASADAGAAGAGTEAVVLAEALAQAKAMYDHEAGEQGELSFRCGDVITVLRQDPSGWWEGRLASGAVGVFPGNYVQIVSGEKSLNIA